ncbi:MAG: hypothetical protein Q9215_003378 [Flavoplaca cf. flavocitrina]
MTRSTTSLLDYLRATNPQLDCTGCQPGQTKSTQGRFLYKSPKIIRPWTDFEIRTLREMDSGAFQMMLEAQHNLRDYSGIAEMPYRCIYDEASLESFLDLWNWQTVSEALAAAQNRDVEASENREIFMAKAGQGRLPCGERLSERTLKPDWAGVKRQTDGVGAPMNILPGDTKLSCKWDSTRIEYGEVKDMSGAGEWMPAIQQIYTYCIKANAQYGYLITDKELLAVRVSWLANPGKTVSKASRNGKAFPDQPRGVLECKIIPWGNNRTEFGCNSHGLTMNLALWWLHMMAAVGHEIKHRELTDETDHRLPPNENMTLKKTGDKRNQRAQTPTGSETQDSFDLKHSQSFRSDASDVRHILSGATLNQVDRQAGPAVAASPRKRTREEPREGGDPGRTRRRVVAPRNSKH